MLRPEIYDQDIVKFEVLKHFGAFVSESSSHMSEYVPYFRRTPELVDRHSSAASAAQRRMSVDERWERSQARRRESDAALQREIDSDAPVVLDRSPEFCSRILNAIESNSPYVFNGNVANTGLVTNLHHSIVEVPILADGCGLHPCYVGELPPALAALNRTSLGVQELAVQGLLQRDRESIYRAVQLDPLTSSLLSLADIRTMVDEMFAADAQYIGF
jgi:alpha-galactosidase